MTVGLYDYVLSRELADDASVTFHALLMAAMRRADSYNAALLRAAFPETWAEM